MLTDIRHPALQSLYDYWRMLAPAGGLPDKSRFDVLALPPASWSRLFVVDMGAGEQSFTMRVVGTYLVRIYGRDMTNRPLTDAEMPGITQSWGYRFLQDMRSKPAPMHFRGETIYRYKDALARVEQVLVPFADDAGRCVTVVGAINYEDVELRPVAPGLAENGVLQIDAPVPAGLPSGRLVRA